MTTTSLQKTGHEFLPACIARTWDHRNQPTDTDQVKYCYYEEKYKQLIEGLECLYDQISALDAEARTAGLNASPYATLTDRLDRMVIWSKDKLTNSHGIIEEGCSIESARFIKAGLLFLGLKKQEIAKEKPAKAPQSASSRRHIF